MKRVFKKSRILVLPVLLVLTLSDVFDHDIDSKFSSENIDLQNMHVMYSYEDVFEKYYNIASSAASGVRYGFLDDTRIAEYEVLILRPVASESQRETAVEFASRQIGKPYSLNTLRLNTDINSEKWYCSELCYASYHYADVDIGMYFAEGLSYTLALGCIPYDIYRSSNTYVKGLVSGKYLDIQIYDYINQAGIG